MKPVLLPLILAGILAAPAVAAAAERPATAHLTIPRLESRPTISDFLAMDLAEAPAGMQRVEGFVQRYPNDGLPASEPTVAYIGYDAQNVYVAFVCFDSSPRAIGAHLVGRDAFPNDEDTVAVHFDTFRDLKHAYGFQVNALGVQTDGIYTEGSGWDLSWDTVWHSEGRLTPRGYVVLVTVPFKSLRFPASDAQEWGLFLYRGVARRNEDAFFPACSTRMTRFPQAALADGIEHVSSARNLQAIPYMTGRSSKVLDLASGAAAFRSKSADGALGVDAKAVIRDSVILDLAVNPDFSQVESDQPQITVNKPFEVFFPEKRPFFLENATFLGTPIQLLFTRRIADPLLGARATGRVGAFSGAAMVVDDRSPFDGSATDARAWYGVARLRPRVFHRRILLAPHARREREHGRRGGRQAAAGRERVRHPAVRVELDARRVSHAGERIRVVRFAGRERPALQLPARAQRPQPEVSRRGRLHPPRRRPLGEPDCLVSRAARARRAAGLGPRPRA